MNVYIDSSVILRLVLGHPDRLREWKTVERGVVSALAEIECLRTIDRFRSVHKLSDRETARRRDAVYRILSETELVGITTPVLARASQPFPTSVGSLDAVHLATALLWREQRSSGIVFATHDAELARAAEAFGFPVIGMD